MLPSDFDDHILLYRIVPFSAEGQNMNYAKARILETLSMISYLVAGGTYETLKECRDKRLDTTDDSETIGKHRKFLEPQGE